MRTILTVSVALILATPAIAQTDKSGSVDPSNVFGTPMSLLDRAIKAHGGEENLNKYKAGMWRGKGTYYGAGVGQSYSGEWAIEGVDRSRMALEVVMDGQKVPMIAIMNGMQGWTKTADRVPEIMLRDRILEEKDQMYANYLSALVPMKDKAYTLTLLPEIKIDKRSAVGIKAVRKGFPEVWLYFDKDTFLLSKTDKMVRHGPPTASTLVKQETIFYSYEEVGGIKKPMKILVKRGGQLYLELDVFDFTPKEKLDTALFQKP
jgi:hypothetical protein